MANLGDGWLIQGDGWLIQGDGWLVQGDGWLVQGDGWLIQGDGWLIQGDGWLIQGDGWLIQGDGWQIQGDGWVAKLLRTRQLSGFESRHLPKIQNGQHKRRSGQHTRTRQKILITMIICYISLVFFLKKV